MAKKNKTVSADSLPLVAIDLGSHYVRAMAAQRVAGDVMHILGVEQSHKFASVEQGIVTQTSNTGYIISEILKLLANRIGVKELPTAFVSMGGRSMQIVEVKGKRDQVRKKEISQALLDDIEAECKQKIEAHNQGVCVLGLTPIYYILDGVEQDQVPLPTQRATLIEAHYTAFVAREEVASRVNKSFDQAGKAIEASFVRQEALLSAFTAEDGERILTDGCAVLDLGAQTTTLSVYKGTEYLFTKVVPQGGYHITRVIEDQGISFAYAEKLKCQYGYAGAEWVERNFRITIPSTLPEMGTIVVTGEELANLIQLKLEEIINPLMVELNKYRERITRLYITGGASMLKGIGEFLQQKTPIRVMYGSHEHLLDSNTDEQYYEPTYSALVGTLLLGSDYRDAHPGQKVKSPKIQQVIEGIFVDLFREPQS